MRKIARFAGEVVAETLWPTRCALCDRPGAVLCDRCARALPFLDWWKACPRCGSPVGLVQCDWCNPVTLGRLGRDRFPFSGCASAVDFTEETGRLVRVYKDQGEQRLAGVLSGFMERIVPPGWRFDAVTFIPASKAAYRHRGFDHAELLARELAAGLSVECAGTLARPVAGDQRMLGGSGRIENVRSGFEALEDAVRTRNLLLVDDVLTTGSTICAATDALLAAGADKVFCLTFARV